MIICQIVRCSHFATERVYPPRSTMAQARYLVEHELGGTLLDEPPF